MPYKTLGKTCEYIRSILPAEPNKLLQAISDYADLNGIPILLPETAALLKQLILLTKPKKILEVGMAIGYSGSLMLLNSPQAHLYTIEVLNSSIDIAKNFFKLCDISSRVTIYEGNSDSIVPFISGEYDFIFLDGPKAQYIEYLPFLSRALASGGILLCDNVLYNGMVSGEVATPVKKNGLVKKLDMFNKALMADKTLISSILQVGDGVSLSIKKECGNEG